MTFSTPGLSLTQTLEVAKQYGFDGIEPRLDAKHAHGIEAGISAAQRCAARKQAEDAGIKIACLATSLRYADPDQSKETERRTRERIDLAADVGVPVMRVFGGQIPDGLSRDKAADLLVDSLSAVADQAEERGVTLCMETHDDWCDPTQVADVLERINRLCIAANWDIMHPVHVAGASIHESFEALKPWIRHLHVHDGAGEDKEFGLVPIGEGVVDHLRALELLKTIDYEGFISGEWINWDPYEEHLPRELATLKRYEQQLV